VNKYCRTAVLFSGFAADRARRSGIVRNDTGIDIASGFLMHLVLNIREPAQINYNCF